MSAAWTWTCGSGNGGDGWRRVPEQGMSRGSVVHKKERYMGWYLGWYLGSLVLGSDCERSNGRAAIRPRWREGRGRDGMRTDAAQDLMCRVAMLSLFILRTKITNHNTREKRGAYSRLGEMSRRAEHHITSRSIPDCTHFLSDFFRTGTLSQTPWQSVPVSRTMSRYHRHHERYSFVSVACFPALYGKFPMYRNGSTSKGSW